MQTDSNTLNSRLSHAILLEGPSGSGKTAAAGVIAMSVLCESDSPPCYVCRHCVKIKKGVHPDYQTFEGEGRSRSFHIDAVREIRTKAFVFPNEAKAKVFLLKNVQDMTVQAQNALLKILEEPPEAVYFILTCKNRHELLETVLSRVSLIRMDSCASEGSSFGNAEKGSGEQSPEARALWEELWAGKELDALARLSKFDRDRKALLELLSALRDVAEKSAYEAGRASPDSNNLAGCANLLRTICIIDIISEISLFLEGNGSVPLAGLMLTSLSRRLDAGHTTYWRFDATDV